ncbi:MAG: UDP-3-O-(3-hydroxymyristoyl)glucosamine N-acyltransferase [Planctomycetota bacterium]
MTGAPNRPGTAGALAEALGAALSGDAGATITSLATLEDAGPGDVVFARDTAHAHRAGSLQCAAAVVSDTVTESDRPVARDGGPAAVLIVPDLDNAMADAIELFVEVPVPREPGVHPTAIVDETATVHPAASVGPWCEIGPGAHVAEGVVLESRVTLGRDAVVGPGSRLACNVVVADRCAVGALCILHTGVVIGTDGFGYRPAPDGKGLKKIPHLGGVRVGNAVEIGAGTCIDRGKLGDTVVGDGTKIDNLVQIGHNVRIGRACVLCGQAGIAGSVVIEDGAVLGGQVGVADHVRIGAMARVGAQAGVNRDIEGARDYFGTPVQEARESMRMTVALRRLAREHRHDGSGS